MHKPYNIRCYDPDAGEDFTFLCEDHAAFSSLQHMFFVIEVVPKTTVRQSYPSLSSGAGRKAYTQLLLAALGATNSAGFVSVSHLTQRLRGRGVPEFEKGQMLCDSALGYFGTVPDEVDRLLASRQECQTYEEWILGGCRRPFDVPAAHPKWYQKALYFDLEFFLHQADRVGCLFYSSGETQEDIILLRQWNGAEKLIAAFVSSGL